MELVGSCTFSVQDVIKLSYLIFILVLNALYLIQIYSQNITEHVIDVAKLGEIRQQF